MTNVHIFHEVTNGAPGEWRLCFQWVRYDHDDREEEYGYRFIWRRPDGTLQAARGQARIPTAGDLFQLLSLAAQAGWFVSAEHSISSDQGDSVNIVL